MFRFSCSLLISIVVGFHSPWVGAQSYPNKPVRFVVPFAPGGQSDIVARLMAQKLSERWGQPVVVDNKAGAATTLGTDIVAKAPADGYTMLLAPAPFVITQYAYPKLPYDSRKDFAPVSLLVTNPLVAVINPNQVKAKVFADFVTLAKVPGSKLPYGTPGNGSLPHLAVELFRMQSGIEALHVPYKGGGPAVADLVSGHIAFMFASPLEVMQHVKSGKLQVLGVTSDQRLSYWPEVPTIKESGYKNYEAYAWFGVVVAANTPKDIVNKLNADIVAILKTPETAEKLKGLGTDPAPTSIEDFSKFLNAEHIRWSAAVKSSNITID